MDDKGKAKARLALEYGPILAFFAGYLLLKDRVFTLGGTEYSGFIVMTALFVPMLLASTLALWRLTGTLSRMQVFTLVIVVVFGVLSVGMQTAALTPESFITFTASSTVDS